MEQIETREGLMVWLGRSVRPYEYTCPSEGEYALLLVCADEDVSAEEQALLSERLVRTGCRYAVCFGPESSSWDDSIDMVSVMDEINGRGTPFVVTTWHDEEPLSDVVEYFARLAKFDDWSPPEYVVLVLGGSGQLEGEVRRALCRQFA